MPPLRLIGPGGWGYDSMGLLHRKRQASRVLDDTQILRGLQAADLQSGVKQQSWAISIERPRQSEAYKSASYLAKLPITHSHLCKPQFNLIQGIYSLQSISSTTSRLPCCHQMAANALRTHFNRLRLTSPSPAPNVSASPSVTLSRNPSQSKSPDPS